MKLKILMVEDDQSVAEMMGMFFEKEGWTMDVATDGEQAVKMFAKNPDQYDLITLDLNLPKKDGIQVAKDVCAISPQIPIIMLTARSSEEEQIQGFNAGADDYVSKPFSPLALIARIKALQRRIRIDDHKEQSKETKEAEKFDVETAHTKISKSRREVLYDGKYVQNITPKEFDLLYTMAQKPKQVFSREQLLEAVWGYDYYGEDRTVDAHIKKLRQKLETVGADVIQTVWGVGYKFDDS
ncbi:MAG: response regulator transcription factor [Lactobacillus helsingborgensis]|uniref:response regulator transcription factor n=1 Tax=Lactobacillus TaxID=1578 RepID=UPI000D701E4B|nr:MULTISPECIES: response regulator transcription factor [Lactobacillus]AWN33285.1 DNA-binding response regulator [Lactobacillus helsingborgensis]MBC6356263.1 response regulator transcription factor [Lactobacillus helsingborgensis]MCT6828346.1 response regulator transcription factor [Lactobacillus helsingborgensis]MCT6847352.1 response regulator transcription factor [Lactobacillus helsingborgensis]RMC53749.1 DNA-binding response regulator [Lactobacillus sp. ESL0262]